MMIVDSHCHASPVWCEPVESLLFQMDRNGVERAVLVQLIGQADNEYQFEATRQFRDRLTSVVWLQADRPEAPEQLRRLADRGISGVRLGATVRSAGPDEFAVWRTAEELDLTVSCNGSTEDFTDQKFSDLVQALPRLRVVVEHLGGHNRPDSLPLEERRRVFELARFPNVYMKIHGLGEFCRRRLPVAGSYPFERPIPPLLALAYQAFGVRRMMWGSDYPPVSGREGYRNALHLTLEQFPSALEEERALIFGRVAGTLFPQRE
jgi:L-fuconolactonase